MLWPADDTAPPTLWPALEAAWPTSSAASCKGGGKRGDSSGGGGARQSKAQVAAQTFDESIALVIDLAMNPVSVGNNLAASYFASAST